MTKSSTGSFRQPHYLDGDAPDVAVNANEVADYAAEFGNHKVGTAAERNAATSWAWDGLTWGDTTDGCNYRYAVSGGAWKRTWSPTGTPFAMAAGKVTNAAGAPVNVVFPVGRFSVPPIITMSNTSAYTGGLNAQAVTKDGFRGGAYDASGNSIAGEWYWSAVQMTSAAAAG
jgi:hypothetical protein